MWTRLTNAWTTGARRTRRRWNETAWRKRTHWRPDNTGGDVNPGGTPTGREGGVAHRRSRSVGGRGSQTDLTLDASPGSRAMNMNDDDDSLSTSAPGTGGSLGHTNSLGLSRRNNNSSFVLAPEDNPTPQLVPPPTFGDQGNIGEKHVLVMVGLPARGEFISFSWLLQLFAHTLYLFSGKTHMAKRLCQYLRFFHGARTQVFNVGSYRRKMMGKARADSEFFRGNGENDALRRSFARAALKDLVDFLFQEDLGSNLEQRASDSGRVAIFDATNTTKERREWIRTSLGRTAVEAAVHRVRVHRPGRHRSKHLASQGEQRGLQHRLGQEKGVRRFQEADPKLRGGVPAHRRGAPVVHQAHQLRKEG